MQVFRPLQVSFNHQVLEQNRKFFFTASATLGINLQTGEELLDLYYLKDAFESMGENPLPDMGMPKPNGEFLVSGNYFAPDKNPVTGGEVKIRLDEKEKNLFIFGPRKWQAGFPSKPEQITTMPLDYTRAFGGQRYEKNPAGIGFNDGLLPCLEDPKHLVASKDDKPSPAGFGPQFSMVPQRMQYQGTYDTDYKEKYFPGFPADHDWKFFLCSPSDQWIKEYYKGTERFSLYNMHPEIPAIEGHFPGLYARCFINQKTNGNEQFGELPLNLDTIWFFPEKLTGLLIFRGVIEVKDDEAENITDILCAYEDNSIEPRSLEYYKKAFEKRRNSDDVLLKNLNTQDLIPEGHKCAMELLMDTALSDDSESELVKNMDAKVEGIKKIADEKVEEAISQAEESVKNINIPDEVREHISDDAKKHMPGKEGGLDIRKLMIEKSDAATDPDVDLLNKKLEEAIPGLTSGDPKKFDLKNFSFDKIDEVMASVDAFSQKKETEAKDRAGKEIGTAKEQIKEQIKDIDKQIDDAKKAAGPEGSEKIAFLEESKIKIHESLKALDDINLDESETKETPLPRVDSDEIIEQISQAAVQIDSEMMGAMQHVQAMKAMGSEEEKIEEMEKEIQIKMDESQKQVDESLEQAKGSVKEAEISFKESYAMAAHFMNKGLSPHKDSLEDVRQRFLDAVSNKESVANNDWACIDLEGENLDGIDLSGAFLEQVNFKGASLKGVNFSKAILARADFEDADLTGTNLEKANVGAVHAHGANFTHANLKSAKLSKGDFAGANFTKADLEEIESLEIIIDHTNFTSAHMPKVNFLDIRFSGSIFLNADMNTSAFIQCRIEDSDFTESIMTKCTFVDTHLENCRFGKADLSNACFVETEPGKSVTKKLDFEGAILKQANFQNMSMQNTNFSYANIENAFFGGTNLLEADLSFAQGKNAQFRKANLTQAKLHNINLDQGSLAKANLADASLKGANLHAVDFLRSNISNTDFSFANLDTTLIEHWRPG